jgi:hypothetical protein
LDEVADVDDDIVEDVVDGLRISADGGMTTERTDVEVDTDVGVGVGVVPPIDIWRTFDADVDVFTAVVGLDVLVAFDWTDDGVANEIDRIDDIDVVSS